MSYSNFINFTILSHTCHTTVTTLGDNLGMLNFKEVSTMEYITIKNVDCFGKMSKDVEGIWVTTCNNEWVLSNLNPTTNEPFSNWTSIINYLLEDKQLLKVAKNNGLELSIDC